MKEGESRSSRSTRSTISKDEPRSILRSRSSASYVGPRIRVRRRRHRHVSFNTQNEVFLIPTRRELREEERKAMRRRRLRRRLTMRRFTPGRRRRPGTKIRGAQRSSRPKRRTNRLVEARRRYLKAQKQKKRGRRAGSKSTRAEPRT